MLPLSQLRPTEQRNDASRDLDRMTTKAILRLMNREDRKVAVAVGRELPAIARAAEAIVWAMRNGGRLIYVGAGTSGRLGVLDAAECPPTFGVSPKMVQGLIAGGRRALASAVEGAEDSPSRGAKELQAKRLSRHDVVVGISASGRTPYVVGALAFARKRGATTVAITSDRAAPITRRAKIVIAPAAGPEILTGSTRLKAGTSQKLVLNMLSTAAMVRLGHAYENLMIDLMLTNQKLRDRLLRILAVASDRRVSVAKRALRQSGHNPRVALLMLKLGINAQTARNKLAQAKDNLTRALEKDG
jgi:N-acetylmuramic acid 6-phosphate etherase